MECGLIPPAAGPDPFDDETAEMLQRSYDGDGAEPKRQKVDAEQEDAEKKDAEKKDAEQQQRVREMLLKGSALLNSSAEAQREKHCCQVDFCNPGDSFHADALSSYIPDEFQPCQVAVVDTKHGKNDAKHRELLMEGSIKEFEETREPRLGQSYAITKIIDEQASLLDAESDDRISAELGPALLDKWNDPMLTSKDQLMEYLKEPRWKCNDDDDWRTAEEARRWQYWDRRGVRDNVIELRLTHQRNQDAAAANPHDEELADKARLTLPYRSTQRFDALCDHLFGFNLMLYVLMDEQLGDSPEAWKQVAQIYGMWPKDQSLEVFKKDFKLSCLKTGNVVGGFSKLVYLLPFAKLFVERNGVTAKEYEALMEKLQSECNKSAHEKHHIPWRRLFDKYEDTYYLGGWGYHAAFCFAEHAEMWLNELRSKSA